MYIIEDAFDAVANFDVYKLKKIIQEGKVDLNERNTFNETLLGNAIWANNSEIVRLLCEQKSVDKNKTTCLFMGEESMELQNYVSPLELAAFIMPARKFINKQPYLDIISREICAVLVQNGAKVTSIEKYKANEKFECCVYDLKQITKELKIENTPEF